MFIRFFLKIWTRQSEEKAKEAMKEYEGVAKELKSKLEVIEVE